MRPQTSLVEARPAALGAAGLTLPRRARPAVSGRPAWWAWLHLSSLDAPLVALVWQRWWARSAGVALPPSREAILGLGVWMIYLADRLADTARPASGPYGTARHDFSDRWRQVILPFTACLGLTLAILTLRYLLAAEFLYGLCLLALTLGYFWLIHRWPGRGWAAFLPKEAAVGAIFSAGTLFFVVCRAGQFAAILGPGAAFFAAACFLNCALITRWERHAQDLSEASSLLNAFPRLSARLRLACVCLALLAFAVGVITGSTVFIPVAVSSLLLAALDWLGEGLSADSRRILADLALLTPLLWIVEAPRQF